MNKMSELFNADIRRIKEASLSDKLVVFVGAGVSMNSGIPNWFTLIEELKKELPTNVTSRTTDYLKIAQIYKNYRGEKEYIEKVRSVLRCDHSTFNPIHEAILALNPSHIVTTNYDDLLEQAVLAKNKQYDLIKEDKDIPYSLYNKYLIKMHGDIKEGNIVLTENDYLNYSSKFPLIETFVKSLFASKLVLFIGFSFDDYNLKVITNKVKNLLNDDFQPMYLLNTGETDYLNKEYYKERGVRVVDYSDLVNKGLQVSLDERSLKLLSSTQGKNLNELIHYIGKFSPFRYNRKAGSIINVLYDSIQYYFEELKVVGGNEIIKLYPFLDEKYVQYSNGILYSDNKEIFAIQESLKQSFSAKKKFLKEFGEKYHKIRKFAVDNYIHWIVRTKNLKDDPQIKLYLKRDFHKKLAIDYFYTLNLKKVLEFIVVKNLLDNNSVSISSLELPYLYYKLNRNNDALVLYREIAKKAWLKKKYIVYFICQINLKNLSTMCFHIEKVEGKDILIQDKDEDIDLDDILFKIKSKDNNLYELLKKVYDYKYILQEIETIEKCKSDISSSAKLISRGGSSYNSFVENMKGETIELWKFINENYIVSEHFAEHKLIYKKAVEGFLISNSILTNDRVFKSSKLEYLDEFHILLIIFNVETKALEEILYDNKILKLYSKDKARFKELIFNSIDSFKLRDFETLGFKETNYKAISNLLILVSKIEFDNAFYIEILQEFISVKSISIEKCETALNHYINSEFINFPRDILLDLLAECFTRSYKKIPASLINNLIICINKSSDNLILNETSNDVIKLDLISAEGTYYNQLICYYKYFAEDLKQIVLSDVNTRLNNKFDDVLCRLAFLHGIIIEEHYIVRYLDEFERYLNLKNNKSADYVYSIAKIYTKQTYPNLNERIFSLSKKDIGLDFLINTDTFSKYEKFDIEWLYLIDNSKKEVLASNIKIKKIVEQELFKNLDNKRLLSVYLDIWREK